MTFRPSHEPLKHQKAINKLIQNDKIYHKYETAFQCVVTENRNVNVIETQVKINLFLCLIKHHLKTTNPCTHLNTKMNAYWGVEVQLQEFLTSALVAGQLSASGHCRFVPWGRVSCTHWIRSWVGTSASLGAVAADPENRTPVFQSVA